MKQMGLNVASDPLMCVEYIGVKGGMVILVADDPGPISSQTEQDTRTFAGFSKVPCFDPSTVQEAYDMAREAFAFSEKYGTPVFLRSTTRVSHCYASIDVLDENEYDTHSVEGFVKDSGRWVIFPRLAYNNHKKIVERNTELSDVFSDDPRNRIYPEASACRRGVAAGGVSFADVSDGDWYADAVRWASGAGIITGWTDESGALVFHPQDDLTREQFAAMLYRYAKLHGQGFSGLWSFYLDYPDAGSVADWAREAMSWWVMQGVINGMNGLLNPQGTATRAQVATMLYRFAFGA